MYAKRRPLDSLNSFISYVPRLSGANPVSLFIFFWHSPSSLAITVRWVAGSICRITFGSPHSHLRRRQWHPTLVLLPGKSHGQRSLVGCSPWGRYQSDVTERLHFHFSLSHNGEGNGNPLQCSCLENPRDGRAW